MEKTVINELEVNGNTYVLKSLAGNNKLVEVNGLKFVMVRTYSAGVHFGYLKSQNGKEVELLNSRRVFYWSGACSLSQLALEGTKKPNDCKISVIVPSIFLTEAIEIISMTETAKTNLEGVKIWKS